MGRRGRARGELDVGDRSFESDFGEQEADAEDLHLFELERTPTHAKDLIKSACNRRVGGYGGHHSGPVISIYRAAPADVATVHELKPLGSKKPETGLHDAAGDGNLVLWI